MTLLSCSCIPDTQQLYSNKCFFGEATKFENACLMQKKKVVKYAHADPGAIGTH